MGDSPLRDMAFTRDGQGFCEFIVKTNQSNIVLP